MDSFIIYYFINYSIGFAISAIYQQTDHKEHQDP